MPRWCVGAGDSDWAGVVFWGAFSTLQPALSACVFLSSVFLLLPSKAMQVTAGSWELCSVGGVADLRSL